MVGQIRQKLVFFKIEILSFILSTKIPLVKFCIFENIFVNKKCPRYDILINFKGLMERTGL